MIEKMKRLFMSSFRWRLLINIVISYILTFIIYSGIVIVLESFQIFRINIEVKYLIAFIISLVIFLFIFFDLMNITLKYISVLSDTIQEVTAGDYLVEAPIEYDD